MLHRLTGFMGEDRRSTEVLMAFHETKLHRNRQPASAECLCQVREHWARGDSHNFLGLVWPAPESRRGSAAEGDARRRSESQRGNPPGA
jgi:hypothetical protein